MADSKVGGRAATTGVIDGDYALSVGRSRRTPPDGWQWTPLMQVARLESGHTPSRKHPEYWGGDIPWIGIRDATGNHGRVLHDTEQHTNALGISKSAARILPAGTVCLSRTASVGYVVVMGRPMATSQDFANWVCGPRIESEFLKYVLLADNGAFSRFSYGSTHQTIYYPELKAFHVCLPPLLEQQAIAATLGALDDKIELNRRICATLEAMARALFRSWFVDFDPVHAKAAGEAPAHMAPATVALFPDRFGDDGLPKGWRSRPIGDAVDIVGGSTPSTKNPAFWDDGVHLWATPRDLSRLQTPILLDTERRITDAGVAQISSRQLPPGTLLLSSRAPIGYLAIAQKPVSVNQGFIAIRETVDLPSSYTLFWCAENMDAIVSNANGSTFQEISKRNFRPLPVVVPPRAVMAAYRRFADPLIAKIAANEVESAALATLRDTLLPKLMSGELRVREAEMMMAKAV